MAQKLSQLYDVDNRYREAKGVADNESGKQFLQEFSEKTYKSSSGFFDVFIPALPGTGP